MKNAFFLSAALLFCACNNFDQAFSSYCQQSGQCNELQKGLDGGGQCRATAGLCTQDGECCSGQCLNGQCAAAGSCASAPESNCADVTDCCAGLWCDFSQRKCKASVTLDAGCQPLSQTCSGDAQCCSGQCLNGVCQTAGSCNGAPGTLCADTNDCCTGMLCDLGDRTCKSTGATCKSNTQACASDTECCSAQCLSGFCSPGGSCNTSPGACNDANDCCAGSYCDYTVHQCKSACAGLNAGCTMDSQCCSGQCLMGTCSAAGACGNAPAGCVDSNDCCAGSYCDFSVSTCKSTCTPENSACSNDSQCCSGQCLAGSCKSPAMCNAYSGAPCWDSTDCCSGSGYSCNLGTQKCDATMACKPPGTPCSAAMPTECCSFNCSNVTFMCM